MVVVTDEVVRHLHRHLRVRVPARAQVRVGRGRLSRLVGFLDELNAEDCATFNDLANSSNLRRGSESDRPLVKQHLPLAS